MINSSSAFVSQNLQTIRSPWIFRSREKSRCALAAKTTSTGEMYVINWECVADTRSYRIPLGIATALEVWPELKDIWDLTSIENDNNEDAHSWLINKLLALAHVFSSENEYSATCDYALATRLLLEEQELDNGESNGKKGKYASRFHPRGTSSSSSSSSSTRTTASNGRSSSTRPLTVGEIAVNWKSTIRETVEIRYRVERQDPLPILQATIDKLQDESATSQTYNPPDILASFPLKGLLNTQKPVLLTVSHRSDWAMAQASLANANVNYHAVKSIQDALEPETTLPLVLLLLDPSKKGSSATLDILKQASKDTTVTIIESSWDRLLSGIALFGEHIPLPVKGNKAKCVVPDRFLSLYLADWPATSHITQQSAATMNPWTNVMTGDEFETLLQPNSFE